MKQAQKWVGDRYVPHELPDSCTTYESDMDKEVTCCSCGRRLKYNDGYTSRTYRDDNGFGYIECEDCYFKGKENE